MGRVLAKRFFGNTNAGGLAGDGLASVTVGGTNNAYIAKPAIVIDAPTLPGGVQAVAAAHMAVVGVTNFTAGTSGYVPAQILTLTGGTGTVGTLTVSTTRVNTTTLVGRGEGYAPTDILTVATGTGTPATATVTTTRVKTVVVGSAPGAGYTTGDVVTIQGGTGTLATATVIASAGAVTGFSSFTAGAYTANPALDEAATVKIGGGGDDTLTVDITMEVDTITGPTAAGSYTVNPTLTGVATTGTGTGATLTLTMGVDTVAITTAGDYTVLPTDVTIVPHTGGGTGAVFNLTFKVLSVQVTTAGAGYAVVPAVVDSPDGNATFVAVLTSIGENAIIAYSFISGSSKISDIVKQLGSRRYRVTNADGTADAALKASAATVAGEMTIVGTDEAAGTYFVTKLTRHYATITRGTGTVHATGDRVKWTLGTAVDASGIIKIQNA